jgi:hypothetical protein
MLPPGNAVRSPSAKPPHAARTIVPRSGRTICLFPFRSDRVGCFVWLDPGRLRGEGANRRGVRFELLSAMQLNVGQNVPDEVDLCSSCSIVQSKGGALAK